MTPSSGRSPLLPAANLPLLYFAFAHVSFALALAALTIRPDLPAAFFHHPRMIAIVHLVTLGWISASILGAFYIVGPLALGMPLPAGPGDRWACAAYISGVAGMVSHFWIGEYSGMAWSAGFVILALLHVSVRAWMGLRRAPVPWGVKLHVALAFANVLGAGLFGIAVGLNREYGWWAWAPVSAAIAHGHLAAIGWPVMMVVGLSYRLIPMIVPAAMPTGGSIALSAVCLELGMLVLVISMTGQGIWIPAGAALILAGLAAFVSHVRAIVRQKRPPPAALRRPDWPTWQTHLAFAWLLVAAVTGAALTLPVSMELAIPVGWIYGTAGLLGFLSQVVVGIQGRLLPLHGWYRMFEAGGMKPPRMSAHRLGSHDLSKWILLAWTCGVPLLAGGLAASVPALVSVGSASLLGAVLMNAAQLFMIATGQHNR